MSLFVMFRLVCIVTTMMAVAASLSRPGCPEKCGNINIPYPFGIGFECSANGNFTLTCRNSTHPPKPFLTNTKMEVLHISQYGTLIVNHHMSPLNCSSVPETYNATIAQETYHAAISLLGTPFTISSEYNSIVVLVLGCQNSITLHYSDGSTGGCTPNCDANPANTNCSTGVNCCVSRISSELQELQYTYKSFGTDNNDSLCGYVFFVEKRWFYNDYLQNHPLITPSDPELQYAPLVLEWELYDSYVDCNGVQASTYSYDYYSQDLGSPDSCYCQDGFTGNPYLPGGCLDVDECSNSSLNYCPSGTCINTPGSYRCHDPRARVKIIFISIGSAFGALILFLVSWVSTKAIRKRFEARRRRKFFTRNGGLLLQQQLSTTNNGLEKTKLFSSKELSQATDHYNENRVLGRGGQGTVYKGMMTDGRIVAIKKSKRVDAADLESFINEVVILSQVNHRNVVKLLGCCLETEVPLLVYEFIPNGTLLQHIQEPNEEFPLSWEIRLRIAREAAGALWYLHSAASTPIYHRDIKSTNILLDDKYRAIVSDFGTSRSVAIDETHLTTRVLGTFGYLDPEYFRSSHFTEKSDVYSFGVVMVELLTGEKAISAVRAEEGKNLALHFLHSMEENRLFEILDPRILTEATREEIVAVAQLSERCLHTSGKRRPTMREVVVELEGIHLPTQDSDSIKNEDDARDEEYGIDVDDESYDFSSVSESMQFEINTACLPNAECPLLDEP